MNLRGRIVLVLALATILPTVLVGVLAVRRARTDVRREVVRGNLALVRVVAARLDAQMQDLRRSLTIAASSWADDAGHAPVALLRARREIPLVEELGAFDLDGRLVAGDPVALGPATLAKAYGATVSLRGRDRALVVVQARTRAGEHVGYFAAGVDLGFVAEALAETRLGPGARLHVVDADGRAIASTEGAPMPQAVTRALAAAEEGTVEAGARLAVYANLSAFQTERGIAWAIILEQPTSEAYALAAATTRDTILAGAAVLAVALLVGFLLASRLTRPLGELATGAARMAREGRPGPLPTDAPGEIGALARQFDEMARRVAERERLQSELARQTELATVGTLAAGMAHEINNPLTSILGYATLLLEDRPGDERLQLIADEARRVQGIVRALLDHARADTGPLRKETVVVNQLVERSVALVAPTLRQRGIKVTTDLTPGLPRREGDPRRLEQVFVNLMQNAAQAGARTVTVTTRGDVEVAVADDGPGIPADHLAKIFDPFFTTKGPGVGTGLGLAIARQIVLDHGGRIEVESEIGRGTTFRVHL